MIIVLHSSTTLLLFGLKYMLFDSVNLNQYFGAVWSVRSLQSLFENIILLIFLSTLILIKANRQKEIQLLVKDKDLIQARLTAFQIQLQPHYLMNALNSVSSLIDIDAESSSGYAFGNWRFSSYCSG